MKNKVHATVFIQIIFVSTATVTSHLNLRKAHSLVSRCNFASAAGVTVLMRLCQCEVLAQKEKGCFIKFFQFCLKGIIPRLFFR